MPGDESNGRYRRWLLSLVLAAVVAVSSFTRFDQYAHAELDGLFQRALITFALARTLNGLISAMQGTELALQPAGVGVTLTPGEILDPINDLVERFSWIMLGATVSLGVQEVLLEVGQWWGVRLVVALLALAWLGARLNLRNHSPVVGLEPWLRRALLIALFLRFAVPLVIVANEAIYRVFLESRYVESSQVIESAGAELEAAARRVEAQSGAQSEAGAESADQPDQQPVPGGWGAFFGKAWDSAIETVDLQGRIERFRERASEVIEHLIHLSVVFILQTGLLPLAFLWLFLAILRRLLTQSVPLRVGA